MTQPETPQGGGSYQREADGSLTRLGGTEPRKTRPQAERATETDPAADADDKPRKAGK